MAFPLYQCNLNKSITASANLLDKVLTLNTFIYLISEQYTYKGRTKKLGNSYTLLESTLEGNKTAILAHPDISIWMRPEFTSQFVTAALWKTGCPLMGDVMLFSVYWHHSQKELPRKLLQGIEFCHRHGISYYVGGDFNAHSPLWEDTRSDLRGEQVENLLFDNNCVLLNEGAEPTYIKKGAHGRINESIIDLSFCSLDFAQYVMHWGVDTQYNGSDHRTIEARIDAPLPGPRKRLSAKDVNVEKWRQDCSQEFMNWKVSENRTMTRNELDAKAREFQDKLTKVNNLHMKEVIVRPRSYHNLWFNNALQKEKKAVGKIHKRAVRTKLSEDWDSFHEAQRQYTRNIQKASRDCYRKMTNDLPSLTDMASFNRMVKSSPRHDISVMRKSDGSFTLQPEEAINIVMDKAFPDSVPIPDSRAGDIRELNDRLGPFTYPKYSFFSVSKIQESFLKFKNSKAAGPDLFKPRLLKQLPKSVLKLLKELFEASYFSGFVPSNWCESKVVFISKPGKTSYSEPGSFRPISLTSFIFKCHERLVYENLLRTSLTDNPLSERQHGFRHGYSTDTALSMALSKIETGMNRRTSKKGGLAIGVFLDVRGAFDNVNVDYCTQAMLRRGFDPVMVAWYSYYLRNRTCFTEIRGVLVSRLIAKGVPQGGILSPLAWNVVYDDMLQKVLSYEFSNEEDVLLQAFADDAGVFAEGSCPIDVYSRVQRVLNLVADWMQEAQLELSAPKSMAVIFRKPTIYNFDPPNLSINGEEIEYVPHARYLGVILDEELNFTEHITKKIAAAKRHIMQLRASMGKLWGPSPYLTRWAYLCIVRPAITFGHIAWGSKVSKHRLALDRVQYLGLKLSGHFRHSTPKDGLNILMNVPPLDLFIKFEVRRSYFRLRDKVIPPLYADHYAPGHLRSARLLFEEMNLTEHEPDYCERLLDERLFFVIPEWEDGRPPLAPNRLEVFTDGSKQRDGSTGFGVFFQHGQHEHRFGQYIGTSPTVFQSEVLAIAKGIEDAAGYLDDHPELPKAVTILSDSQSALKALKSTWIRSKTVCNTIEKLNQYGYTISIRLRWVKGHAGHFGNEQADQIANEAASSRGPLPLYDVPRSASSFQDDFKCDLYDRWTERWQSDPTWCRQTKIWFPEPSIRKSKQLCFLGRELFSRVVRWLSGHAFLRLQNHRANTSSAPDQTALCRLCGEVYERADHVLLHCPRLSLTRAEAFSTLNIDTDKPEWEVRNITKFLSTDAVSNLESPEDQFDRASHTTSPGPHFSPPPSPTTPRSGSPRPSTSRGRPHSISPSPPRVGASRRAASSQRTPPQSRPPRASRPAMRLPSSTQAAWPHAASRAHNISPSPPRLRASPAMGLPSSPRPAARASPSPSPSPPRPRASPARGPTSPPSSRTTTRATPSSSRGARSPSPSSPPRLPRAPQRDSCTIS